MDVRLYYQKIRQTENSIPDDYAVVVSLETSDGGKSGVKTQVSRHIAAKLMIESRARLANQAEAAGYHADQELMRRRAEETEAGNRVQVTLLSESDMKSLKTGKSVKQ
jgi:hypothetical protein